ncbi:MAG: GNAT family N-acetyltransferase [Nitrosospira sp.]|nr:GNAT family N-acetyltransferase [Nitrosospira sp.]MDN5882119.1 GNAT family N-acetyltransferase [Nitrosospira sp.]MDN5935690.1 GNAT family N-acetyltransferase [Nitrosospira sp.]
MLTVPEPLALHHQIETFDSGVASLDDWLKRRAAQNQASGATRTFVTCEEDRRVIAYYALASSAVAPAAASGRFRRNMPDPVPVVVLARLAITRSRQRQGLGRAMFQDAVRRVIHAAEAIGIRGLLVHALSEEANAFYLNLGLDPSPLEPMTLMATVADLRAALA